MRGSGSAGSATRPDRQRARARRARARVGSKLRPPEEEEVGRKTHEFPLGDAGDKLIKDFTAARALRDLGTPNDEQKKDYKLDDAKTTLTVTFKDGARRRSSSAARSTAAAIATSIDQAIEQGYVLSKDLISALEIGESSAAPHRSARLRRREDRSGHDRGGRQVEDRVRVETGGEGQQVKTWGDAETKKAEPDARELHRQRRTTSGRPSTHRTLKLERHDAGREAHVQGATRAPRSARCTLYKHEKPGELAEGQELDPANPPKGETEYYILTEKTRVPGLVRKDTAQRTENDIQTVFSGKTDPTERAPAARLDRSARQSAGFKPGSAPTAAGADAARRCRRERRAARDAGSRPPVAPPHATGVHRRRGVADARAPARSSAGDGTAEPATPARLPAH